MEPIQRTQSPIVVGTSVIAIKYKDGIVMAADTLGSYGSLARFTDQRRMMSVHNSTLIGASGDFSDYQFIKDKLDELEVFDYNQDDGCDLTAPEVYHYLQRLMYHRRNKFDPLWSTLLIAGVDPNTRKPFLGQSTMIGLAFEGDYLATGFGHHFAMPILRKSWREDLTLEEAKKLLLECMRICLYRDCRTINRIQIAKVDGSGVDISEPVQMDTKWDYKLFVDPKSQFGGSW